MEIDAVMPLANRKIHMFILLSGLLLAPLRGADFHILPGEKALQKAIEVGRQTPGPHTILLAQGRYFNESAIVLDERDSGLTIKGDHLGAVAEIFGGVPITGWEHWKGDIWRAPVPAGRRFFNLIVDGQPATMAQRPKAGSGFGGGARKLDNGAVNVPPDWRGYDYSDAQVFAFIGNNWFSEMREVLAAKPDAEGKLKVDAGQSAQFGGMNDRFFLRGILEFLDEPGEWCLKHNEGYVYYWPKNGTPADHLIVRPTAERLFDIHGRSPQTPVSKVTLANLSLIGSDFCARWYLFAPRQDGSTPDPLQQGLVFGENVEGLNVSDCKILAAGHSGVWLNKFAQDCVVENSMIIGAGFTGVYANGFMPGEGPFASAQESYVNKGHRIENNFIYDCGKYVGGGCGIQFYQAGDSLILRNEIGQMPRYGISFKGNRWGSIPKNMYGHTVTFETHFDYLHTRNLKVIGNEIYSVCRNSFDFGAIESWGSGRDNLWERNAIHDLDQTISWGGFGRFLMPDDASHFLTIRGNICYHGAGGDASVNMPNIDEVVENNFFLDSFMNCAVFLYGYAEPGGNYVIRRNIWDPDCIGNKYGPSLARQAAILDSGYPRTIGQKPAWLNGIREIDFNLFASPRKSDELVMERGGDIHSYFGDARLIRSKPDWDITFRDYSLAPDSPAHKLGIQPIDAMQIGLKPNFPFDKLAATRRRATEKIQAEDYQRMHDLHTSGGTGIFNLLAGSWAKYANIDFGTGVTKAVFQLINPKGEEVAGALASAELRLDSPQGKLIGSLARGQSECSVEKTGGVHNLYLVFPAGNIRSVDCFRFE